MFLLPRMSKHKRILLFSFSFLFYDILRQATQPVITLISPLSLLMMIPETDA